MQTRRYVQPAQCFLQFRGPLCALVLWWFALSGSQAQVSIVVPETIDFADQVIAISEADRDSLLKWSNVLTRNNRYLRNYLDRADAFMPIVERILTEENVPLDLKYIVLVESSLVSDLVSTSNAVGYWQFKYPTARDWKLRCDSAVDQRMNIVASTRAAARFLANNNRVLNNWLFTVVSYYQGLTGAQMVVGKSLIGVKDYPLSQLGHKYAYKVLAHKLVFQELLYRNGVPLLQVAEYDDCEGQAMADIAAKAGVQLEELRFFNKWLRTDTVPTDLDYTVILPYRSENRNLVLAMCQKPVPGLTANLEPYEGKKVFFNLITIKDPALDTTGKGADYKSQIPLLFNWNGLKAIMARPGDNINKLALQGGIDRDDFLDYNDMKVYDLISVGQVYYLETKRRKAKVPFHVVRDGETMWTISQNYGVKLKHLLRKNRMEQAEKLKSGRVIWLRKDRPESTPVEYKAVPEDQPLVPTMAQLIKQVSASNKTQVEKPAPPKPVSKPVARQEPILVKPQTQPKDEVRPTSKFQEKPTLPVANKPAEKPVEPVVNPYADLKAPNLVEEEAEDSLLVVQHDAVMDDSATVSLPSGKLVDQSTATRGEQRATPPPAKAEQVQPKQPVMSVLPEVNKLPIDTSKPGAKLPPVPKYQYYVLEPGETLLAVADKLNIPLDSIIVWNYISENTLLKPGVSLRFRPAFDLKIEQEARLQKQPVKPATTKEVVLPMPEKQPGNTLIIEERPTEGGKAPDKPKTQEELQKEAAELARRKAAEQAKKVQQEQAIKPETQPQQPASSLTKSLTLPDGQQGLQFHEVKSGETLYSISRKYGLTVQQLLELNKKTNNTISVGEKLKVKP